MMDKIGKVCKSVILPLFAVSLAVGDEIFVRGGLQTLWLRLLKVLKSSMRKNLLELVGNMKVGTLETATMGLSRAFSDAR